MLFNVKKSTKKLAPTVFVGASSAFVKRYKTFTSLLYHRGVVIFKS